METSTKLYIILAFILFFAFNVFFWGNKLKNYDFTDDVEFVKERILHNKSDDIYENIYSSELDRRNTKRISDLTEIVRLINIYNKDFGDFPDVYAVNGSLTQTGIFSLDHELNPFVPEYTNTVYRDPLNNSICNYTYMYQDNNFILFSHMEETNEVLHNKYYCFDSFSNKLMIVENNPTLNFRCE